MNCNIANHLLDLQSRCFNYVFVTEQEMQINANEMAFKIGVNFT